VLKTGCVNRGVFNDLEHKALPPSLEPIPAYEVHPGDVLMSRASGSVDLVGSVALVEACKPRLMLSDKIYRLQYRPEMVTNTYLTLALNSSSARYQIQQAISGAEGLANNISKYTVREIWIALPPLFEQQHIVHATHRTTENINSLIAKAQSAVSLLKEHRASLISAAVTGKIDVRGFVAHAEEC
jgi:type I restriction enzyme, S subunit